MVKIARCFTVDDEAYKKARGKHINISEAAEFGIRSALKMDDADAKAEKMDTRIKDGIACMSDRQITKCYADIAKSHLEAKRWVRIIKYISGKTLSEAEIVKVFG
ncbi:unnamed protein product [marine sediment metagenome]|uniref:Uncharacterized protein n=1 Tax=marine sediment metagenome TaxID=412755 RepID=X1C592_9ZZZZ